jgi:uncharacterized protein YjbJ (UPF0337 family)
MEIKQDFGNISGQKSNSLKGSAEKQKYIIKYKFRNYGN